MPILNMIAQGSGGGGGGSNVGEPTNLSAMAISNSEIEIKWTDNSLQAIPPSTFQKSVLVRKVGSAPTTPSDGTTVVTETVMNTYQSSAYTDTGLTQGTTYYYQVFSYSTDGGITYGTPASATPQAGWQPNPSRTIFYYDFENSSNRLEDSSGNNNDATTSSNVTYTQVGGQYVAEASNNQVNIETDFRYASSIGSGDFTISFWIYPVASGSYSPMPFGIFNQDSPYDGPLMLWNTNGTILMRLAGNNAKTTSAVSFNAWHHIVMTRNSGTVNVYIDNTEDLSWSDNAGFPASSSNGIGIIFSRYDGGTTSQTWYAGAKGDKFILENVGWSASDVTVYYNQTKGIYGL